MEGVDGLVTEVAVLLLVVLALDELGVWAPASIDTKPVIRKILIINMNFFIALRFCLIKDTNKTRRLQLRLMLNDDFFVDGSVVAFDTERVNPVKEVVHRDVDGLGIYVAL